MAVISIPQNLIRQPSDQLKNETTGLNSYACSWKGPKSDVDTFAASLNQGDTYDGKTLSTWTVDTIPGDWKQVTLQLTDTSTTGSTALSPLIEKWSVKSCRNDVSILGYCGPDNDSPNRAWIECWQKENDASVARSGNYTKPDGSESDLSLEAFSAATSELMAKIEKGVESVIRFYPMVVRRRVYSAAPSCLENLGEVNTPSIGANARNPGNLSSKLSEYEWLKVQDDADQTSANEWQRVESWMGIKKQSNDDHPWDPDLYGPNRWPMPYHHSTDSTGGAE